MTEYNQNGKPIVVGVDGSPQSLEALRQARRLAELTGCPLKAIIVWEYSSMMDGMPGSLEWNPQDDAAQALADALDAAFGSDAPTHLEQVVVQGHAARVLTEESRGAEILVVGSRGRGGFAGLLLGSVSSAVAAHARCPVLITHQERAAT